MLTEDGFSPDILKDGKLEKREDLREVSRFSKALMGSCFYMYSLLIDPYNNPRDGIYNPILQVRK